MCKPQSYDFWYKYPFKSIKIHHINGSCKKKTGNPHGHQHDEHNAGPSQRVHSGNNRKP